MRLAPRLSGIRAVGAEMIFIGNGKPEHAARFLEAVPEARGVPLFTDPRRATYRAAGMTRGVLKVLGPKALINGFRALREGNRQSLTKGDAWQNGGVVVLDRKGKIVFTRASGHAGDPIDIDEILRFLEKKHP